MSRYPAEHCVPYRSRACDFSAMDTAVGFPPTAMASRHAASCVLARQRLAAARPSTATPAATVAKNAANSRPGDRKIRSRCRNATHGPFGSDHPKNPSMYMDTGAMRSLQNRVDAEPVEVASASASASAPLSATHVGAQS